MEARFVTMALNSKGLPNTTLPEVGVVGRSNCGKSSLINALTCHNKLARTSSTPGRTQALVFFYIRFDVDTAFHLVDLPGYGYARVSANTQNRWADFIPEYLEKRSQLKLLLLLMDIRRSPQKEEYEVIEWARKRELRFCVVLTKSDKVSRAQRLGEQKRIRRDLNLTNDPPALSKTDPVALSKVRKMITGALSSQQPSRQRP